MTEASTGSPLIFTHYGDSDYLSRTLAAARLTNSRKRFILIGDAANRQTALEAGWEHVHLDDYTSALRSEFLSVFKIVKGSQHISPPGDRNWVQYVLERWFILTAFAQAEGLESFWHFDSDVMIATPLDPFEVILVHEGFDYTKQCSGSCLNGFVRTTVAEDYCRYIVQFFRDEARLAQYQKQFDELNPNYALTEMEVFVHYDQQPPSFRGCHLESHFPGWWFDDVLCECDDCDTVRMAGIAPVIKDVRFHGNHFTVMRKGERVKLGAINCSWLPVRVFDWVLARTRVIASGAAHSGEDKLGALWPGVRHIYRALRARLMQLANG